MKAIEKLKSIFLTARKEKDTVKVSLYSYLLGQINNKSKEPTDDECYAIYKAFIKTTSLVEYKDDERKNLQKLEIGIVNDLLPKNLTVDEIKTILGTLDINVSDYGTVMKYFKANYLNRYDALTIKDIVAGKL